VPTSGIEGGGKTQAHGQDLEDAANATPTTMTLRGGITTTYKFVDRLLALLREEEERLGRRTRRKTGDISFRHSLFSLGLSFAFLLSYSFWRSASGRLRLDGSGP